MNFRVTIDSMDGSENLGSFDTKEEAIAKAQETVSHLSRTGCLDCSVAVRQRKQMPNGPMVVWPIVADFDPS